MYIHMYVCVYIYIYTYIYIYIYIYTDFHYLFSEGALHVLGREASPYTNPCFCYVYRLKHDERFNIMVVELMMYHFRCHACFHHVWLNSLWPLNEPCLCFRFIFLSVASPHTNPCFIGKTDSIHHHHLKGNFETATVPELRQKPLYTTPSGWWWCIESVFRFMLYVWLNGLETLLNKCVFLLVSSF